MRTPFSHALRSSRAIAFGLVGASLLSLGNAASAQFDATVDGLEVTQAIFTNDASLVAGRSTMVRASVGLVNPPMLPLPLDGLMRVFVDGVEAPDSPIFSDNGPFPAQLSANAAIEDGTLNFIFLPPLSGDVVVEIEVNSAGANFVPEANTSNNKLMSASMVFNQQKITELAYAPIDYRPSGGSTPNLPDPVLIEPGSGDNFVQGIYPTSDWDYHRIDAPSKLWTSSLSGSGTGLLNSLKVDIALMVPVPDFLYGWVPGGLPYNGVAFLNDVVSLGNTQTFKFQRTFAHEVGHNFGLSHNSFKTGRYGVDIEHHLNITEGLPIIKSNEMNDIMVPGLNTNQAWIRTNNYNFFFNHPVFNVGPAPAVSGPKPATMITGIWNTETGAIEVSHVLRLPSGTPSQSASAQEAVMRVRAFAGGDLAHELSVAAGSTLDSCADAEPAEHEGEHDHADSAVPTSPLVAFAAVLPEGSAPIDRLEIVPAGSSNVRPATLVRSASAPVVQFTSPTGDVSDGQVRVSWTGTDADGDAIAYYLRYSPDGTRFIPLATGITETEIDVDLTQMPALVDGLGYFELLASDGLNTSLAQSPVLTGSDTFFGVGGNDPWLEIMTPDAGKTYAKSATVILHSSGWDLEDRSLSGTAIQWTSDLDGSIGSGRVTSSASLSVGTHMITAQATDSGGLTDSDTHMITIVDRGLPDVGSGSTYCTAKLASAGCLAQIGSSGVPSVSSPSSFDVTASGVLNNKNGLVFYGYALDNSPFQGGILCVMPPLRRTGVQPSGGNVGPADCSGSFTFDFNAQIQSGLDPMLGAGVEVFSQYWYRDPADITGFGIALSNALRFVIQS